MSRPYGRPAPASASAVSAATSAEVTLWWRSASSSCPRTVPSTASGAAPGSRTTSGQEAANMPTTSCCRLSRESMDVHSATRRCPACRASARTNAATTRCKGVQRSRSQAARRASTAGPDSSARQLPSSVATAPDGRSQGLRTASPSRSRQLSRARSSSSGPVRVRWPSAAAAKDGASYAAGSPRSSAR